MAHSQHFYMQHLPSLTDFGKKKNEEDIIRFLEQMVFGAMDCPAKSK
jgi:hypothetical protein